MRKYTKQILAMELLVAIVALIYLSPFYLVVVNSFKGYTELLVNTASFPTKFVWENYSRAWSIINLPKAMLNTIVITIFSNVFLIVFASMAAYRLARYPTRVNRLLFLVFVSTMVIPFQSIMIPLVQFGKWFYFINTMHGIIIVNVGLICSFTIFLYHGYIKSIPREVEESAVVDGCNPYNLFWVIVFPLLKPMTVTAFVLQSIILWNQFLEALLFLQNKELYTIQLAIRALFGEYVRQWDLALAALCMSMLPVLVFFLVMQKHIVNGITAGAVKG